MRNLLLILLVFALVSCAAAKPSPDAFDRAEQAIDAAVLAGAEEHSPVELRFAREKLQEAHKGIEYKQYDKTLYLIEQSEINAELAIEKTRSAIVRGKVSDLARENEILRQEFEQAYGEAFQ